MSVVLGITRFSVNRKRTFDRLSTKYHVQYFRLSTGHTRSTLKFHRHSRYAKEARRVNEEQSLPIHHQSIPKRVLACKDWETILVRCFCDSLAVSTFHKRMLMEEDSIHGGTSWEFRLPLTLGSRNVP